MRENSPVDFSLSATAVAAKAKKPFAVYRLAFAVLCFALALVSILSVSVGAVEISPLQVVAILAQKIYITLPFEFTAQQESVLTAIRLPRVLLALLVGAGLAVCGAILQGIFRNPLADPSLVGVSNGAALAVAAAIVLGETLTFSFLGFSKPILLPFAAFFGGLAATLFIYRVGRRRDSHVGGSSVAAMLLAGIAVNAFAGAGIGLMSFLATDAQLRNFVFWSLGSVGGANWTTLAVAGPLIVLSIAALVRMGRDLNVFLLGEAEARHLGVNTTRLKWQAIALVALSVGASVAVAGGIGFVGLVVPHLLRLTTGADHRYLLINSALLGANLLLAADILARSVLAPAELPIGVVTALVGAPFFIWLLIKRNI